MITPTEFYKDVNQVFGGYNKFSNFLTYLVDGSQHTFTPHTDYYDADALGPKDSNSANNTETTLVDWMNSFPLSKSESQHTVCLGETLKLPPVGRSDNSYCSSSLIPKTFTQK